jgi:ribosome maturation factor RimP
LDLDEASLRRAGGRMVLRILVDRDGGVTLDDVAAMSNRVSAALDETDAMGELPYLLDVGSPGVDRPLTLLRHWRRNTGRMIRITRSDGSVATGRITGAAGPQDGAPPTSVAVESGGAATSIPAEQIRRAVVQVEFSDGGLEE